MRICLLGTFSGNPDEGMKNVSKSIRDNMLSRNNILALNIRDIFKIKFFRNLRSFKPDIIHYLHGPTIRSFIILKIVKTIFGSSPGIICSATKPYFSYELQKFLPLFRPDLILTQSLIWEEFFKKIGFKVHFIPNGVDRSKFTFTSSDEKKALRSKWKISHRDFVILHVGHIRKNRNLDQLIRIQKIPGIQVVIAAGTTSPVDEELKNRLIVSGCIVYHRYIHDIESLYKLSDLYIFPTQYRYNSLPQSYNEIGAIDIPLSVLEAMACNLSVITTRFGALPRIFVEGRGLSFYDESEDIYDFTLRIIKNFPTSKPQTRQQTKSLAWENIIARLERYYEAILKDKGRPVAYRH